MASNRADRMGTYAQRLIENEYVQDNLARAATNLRGAMRRASKRRVEPMRDEKLRRQLREAALSLREATSALQTGRRKPKKRRGRRVLLVLVLGAGVAAAVVASNQELRNKLLRGGSAAEQGSAGAPSATDARSAPVVA